MQMAFFLVDFRTFASSMRKQARSRFRNVMERPRRLEQFLIACCLPCLHEKCAPFGSFLPTECRQQLSNLFVSPPHKEAISLLRFDLSEILKSKPFWVTHTRTHPAQRNGCRRGWQGMMMMMTMTREHCDIVTMCCLFGFRRDHRRTH
jgi:hypothetical protein